jgi:hypothetical protein
MTATGHELSLESSLQIAPKQTVEFFDVRD